MSPGNQNGKNYGGGHTGVGKKNKKGIYTNNGVIYSRQSHKMYKPGMKVYFVKTGEIGEVLENDVKGPRKMKKIKFEEKTMYIPSNLLILENYSKNYVNNKLQYYSETLKKNKYIDLDKRESNNNLRKEFREAKKRFRKEILEEGVYVKYTENIIDNKKYMNSSFDIKKLSDNDMVNDINKKILKEVINIDKKLNSKGYIGVHEFNIPKVKILKNYLKTGCGSTTKILGCNNKTDYYNIVCNYMGKKDTIENKENIKNKRNNKKVKVLTEYELNRLKWGLN
jgi:hypothetical protein